MASSYKYLGTNDRVVSTTNLTEQVTEEQGAAWSATGLPASSPVFVKYSSSSLNVFDVTIGRSGETTSSVSLTLAREQANYNQMAKVLLGHDVSGEILKFSLDADASTSNNILHNAIFLNFARTQFKDKIKSGTFKILVNVSGASDVHLSDTSGAVGPTVREAQTGEVGLLYVSGAATTSGLAASINVTGGLIFYEAGIAVVSPYIFSVSGAATPPSSSASTASFDTNSSGILNALGIFSGSNSVGQAFLSTTSPISCSAYGFSSNLLTASFQAVTELNSTVYFCRAFNNEFNYSSNPTYLSSSQIVVKEGDPMNQPVSYITSVGLYDDNNQLLAVAKLSEPIKKTPDTELIARVRLDF